MLLFFSTYCSIVPLWQSKQVTECDWGRCSELSWHRGRTDQLWIVLYRQISPPVHAIHGVILCVCVRGKSGYYGSVLTRSTVTCVLLTRSCSSSNTSCCQSNTKENSSRLFIWQNTSHRDFCTYVTVEWRESSGHGCVHILPLLNPLWGLSEISREHTNLTCASKLWH